MELETTVLAVSQGASMSEHPELTQDTVLACLANETSIELSELKMDRLLSDLGIESLDVINVVFELEGIYSFELDQDLPDVQSVGDLVSLFNPFYGSKLRTSA